MSSYEDGHYNESKTQSCSNYNHNNKKRASFVVAMDYLGESIEWAPKENQNSIIDYQNAWTYYIILEFDTCDA